jgi:hypothetical protein
LTTEARPIAERAAAVYLEHTAPWFIGLIAHGSAVKGGTIPGCSDIDFQLFLEDPAFSWHGQLPLELGFAIRRDLVGIDLGPFRYIQCYPLKRRLGEGWVGPIPGTYHLVAGQLPVAEATAPQLCASASRALAELDPAPSYLMGKLLGPGDVRLARALRLLCTQVWPALYHVLTLQGDDPIATWCLNKAQALDCLPKDAALGPAARRFYRAVSDYYPAEDSLEGALAVIESGVACLAAAKSWWDEASTKSV